uniref:Serpentine receptor class gamma n=1 Tax=Caenorhabditis japonica TaxID=281687 RepID=A0A8R1DII3_CAEJA
MDYSSNFFSLTITFFMSLNRCLLFTAKRLNAKIFDRSRWIIPFTISAISSIFSAAIAIITSNIHRLLYEFGFIDFGFQGWKVVSY